MVGEAEVLSVENALRNGRVQKWIDGRDIAIEGSHVSGMQGVAISAGRDLSSLNRTIHD